MAFKNERRILPKKQIAVALNESELIQSPPMEPVVPPISIWDEGESKPFSVRLWPAHKNKLLRIARAISPEVLIGPGDVIRWLIENQR